MMLICPRVTQRIPIAPRIIFRQTFHWLRDCFPITECCSSQWWSHPHFVARDCRWPGRRNNGAGDDRDHEIEKGGIHARKYLLKEEESEAEDLRRSGSGEKGMGPCKPRT